MKPTPNLAILVLTALLLFPSPGRCSAEAVEPYPDLNIPTVTVDDMNADSVGAFGCRLADTTPNLDRLAAQGMRCTRAHVVCANCMPSRNAMWSGLYHHSTHTPLLLVVPGVSKPGSVDHDHLIFAVDLLPTLLELSGTEPPSPQDGRSFAPRLNGVRQKGRDGVIKEYNENAGGSRDPMRAIQTRKYLYLFDPWSNGQRIMATATSGTPTYRRLAQLARTDPALEARHRLYQLRVPEELYDVEQDPDCLKNLIDSPAHQEELRGLCQTLEQRIVRTDDPMLDVFRKRGEAAVREAFVAAQEKEAEARRMGGRGKAKPKAAAKTAASKAARRRNADGIALVLPPNVAIGKPITVKIEPKPVRNICKAIRSRCSDYLTLTA